MAEWLTREIRNLFLSEGAGSNPAGVVFWPRKGAKNGEVEVENTPKIRISNHLCVARYLPLAECISSF